MNTFISIVLPHTVYLFWAQTRSAHLHHHSAKRNLHRASPIHPALIKNKANDPKCSIHLMPAANRHYWSKVL